MSLVLEVQSARDASTPRRWFTRPVTGRDASDGICYCRKDVKLDGRVSPSKLTLFKDRGCDDAKHYWEEAISLCGDTVAITQIMIRNDGGLVPSGRLIGGQVSS